MPEHASTGGHYRNGLDPQRFGSKCVHGARCGHAEYEIGVNSVWNARLQYKMYINTCSVLLLFLDKLSLLTTPMYIHNVIQFICKQQRLCCDTVSVATYLVRARVQCLLCGV